MAANEEEWADVITFPDSHEEYGKVSEVVGKLTSAILDCRMKGIMTPSVAKSLRGFLSAILLNLED